MFKEETKELKMSNGFSNKLEMICKFSCVKYKENDYLKIQIWFL